MTARNRAVIAVRISQKLLSQSSWFRANSIIFEAENCGEISTQKISSKSENFSQVSLKPADNDEDC
jgi:hypothetical protein